MVFVWRRSSDTDKRKLLKECNVHIIVRLPQGVLNPYARIQSCFEKETNKEIWYYQPPIPKGMKQYTKNRGIHKEWIQLQSGKRTENDFA